MWLVMVTTDTGASEDGNPHYMGYHGYATENEALKAAAAAFGTSEFSVEDAYGKGKWYDFTDKNGNWLIVVECSSDPISLQIEDDEE